MTITKVRELLAEAQRSVSFAQTCSWRAYHKVRRLREAVIALGAECEFSQEINKALKEEVERLHTEMNHASQCVPEYRLRQFARLMGVKQK